MIMQHLYGCTNIVASKPGIRDRVRLVIHCDSGIVELNLSGLPEDMSNGLLDALAPKPPPDFRDDQDERDVKLPYRIPRDPDAREEWEL